jgi:hypothetical protein
MNSILLLDQLTFSDLAPASSEISFQSLMRIRSKGKCGEADTFCDLLRADYGFDSKGGKVEGEKFFVRIPHLKNVF